MHKKSAILGLILLLAGIIAYEWILIEKRKEQQQLASYKLKYSSETDKYLKQFNRWLQLTPEERALSPWAANTSDKTKTEAQLIQEQQERLKADLDKLAAGETQVHPFADVLYGKNWQNKLKKYKSQKELRESIFTSSIVCTSTGGVIFTWCILQWLIKALSRLKPLKKFFSLFDRPLKSLFANVLGNRKEAEDNEKELREYCGKGQTHYDLENQDENHSATLSKSDWQNSTTIKHKSKRRKNGQAPQPEKNAKKIAVLLSDEKYTESEQPLSKATERPIIKEPRKSTPTLKGQAEYMEEQMAELKKMANTVQKTTLEHSKPLNNAIKELTQQVSAIREYAAFQQNRVEKLQDGYDWNIVRTFCLRIIRCIDNLENRISQLSKEGIETADLKEVKDELIFALESSGIEQFEPEVNSDYRGQEKFAEAVKQKQPCNNSKQTGKIAKVIRPGYQYFISENNIKVVRTAQVKLFG